MDARVGRQLSRRRRLLGLTDESLAETLGLTVQQVRAYEAGTSPIVASQLHEFAQLLGVSVGFFFQKSGRICADRPVFSMASLGIDADDIDAIMDLPSAHEVWRLVRQFSRIADPDLRDFAIDQIEAMAERRMVSLRPNQS